MVSLVSPFQHVLDGGDEVRAAGDDRLGLAGIGLDCLVVALLARILRTLGKRVEVLVEGVRGSRSVDEDGGGVGGDVGAV